MKSPIKWVGSKKWIVHDLVPVIRKHLRGTYYEPFAGGAAIFFALEPQKAVLSDTIYPLIATYQFIQTDFMDVRDHLAALSKDTNYAYVYNAARTRFNEMMSHAISNPETAALFLYLNKMGFNGLWRQNLDGEFNVPFGQHKTIHLPTLADLTDASRILQKAELIHLSEPSGVLDIISRAKAGDVVFADPPYFQTFDGYDGIQMPSADFQQRIAIALWQAHLRGATIIAMNNSTDETNRWYGAFCEVSSITRHQNIAGKAEDRKQWDQILAIAI